MTAALGLAVAALARHRDRHVARPLPQDPGRRNFIFRTHRPSDGSFGGGDGGGRVRVWTEHGRNTLG